MSVAAAIQCYFYIPFLSFPNESQHSRVIITAAVPFLSGSCPHTNQASITRVKTAKCLCARMLLSRKVDLQHNSIFQHQSPQQHSLLIHPSSYLLLSISTKETCLMLTGYFLPSLLERQKTTIPHMTIKYPKAPERNNKKIRPRVRIFFIPDKKRNQNYNTNLLVAMVTLFGNQKIHPIHMDRVIHHI